MSEGHRKVGSLLKDLKGGLAVTAFKHVQFLRANRGTWDKVITVGDFVGPLLAKAGGHRVSLHLDVYNSGYARSYSSAEKAALRHTVEKVLCRDDVLAGSLRAKGIDAGFAGNLMMDTIPELGIDVSFLVEDKIAVTLLPGSRQPALEMFALEINAVSRLSGQYPLVLLVPVAQSLDVDDLVQCAALERVEPEMEIDTDYLGSARTHDGTKVHFFRQGIGTLAPLSRLVAGPAGTAGFQSAGLGTPVVALVPDDARPQRRQRNSRLMGDSRVTSPINPAEFAKAIAPLLESEKEAKRRGKIGVERIGPPGALEAAVRIITA